MSQGTCSNVQDGQPSSVCMQMPETGAEAQLLWESLQVQLRACIDQNTLVRASMLVKADGETPLRYDAYTEVLCSSPMLLTRVPKCSCTVSTWSTISCGRRLRAKPPLPVAQNVHRIGQPTCEHPSRSSPQCRVTRKPEVRSLEARIPGKSCFPAFPVYLTSPSCHKSEQTTSLNRMLVF